MRAVGTTAADFPGTVLIGSLGMCSNDYQRSRRPAPRPPKPKASFMASVLSEADMVAITRLVLARFPNEPELLRMLGIAL